MSTGRFRNCAESLPIVCQEVFFNIFFVKGAYYPDEICTLLYFCTFESKNPELKPGNNVLLFPGFVLSKVQKDNNIFNNIVDVRRTRIVLFVLFAKLGMRR